MSLLESAFAASHRRARAAACLQSSQDDANVNNNDAVETEDAANANNGAVESVDATNANGDAVEPKDAADACAKANYISGDESSTNTAEDRAASISADNLAAAIANATNARRPAPTPLYTTVTDSYKAIWNLGDTKQMATFARAAEPDSDHARFDVGVPNASTLMYLVDEKASL